MAPTGGARGESGAALLLVMAFMVIILVIAASLFELAMAGTTSLKGYQEDRAFRYAADGALEYGVVQVKSDPTLGVSNGNGCSWFFPIEGRLGSGPDEDRVFAPGSRLTVECQPYQVSSGADTDGGQKIRYVEFTVLCTTNPNRVRKDKPDCGFGSSTRIIGRARVRYDLDYTKTQPADAAKRAIIPKVITWDLER